MCLWNAHALSAHLTVKTSAQRNAAALRVWALGFPGGSGWRLHTDSLPSVCAQVLGDPWWPFWAWGGGGAETFLDLDMSEEGRQSQGQMHEMKYCVCSYLGDFPSCSKMLIEIICSVSLFIGQFVSKGCLPHPRSLVKFYV